MKRKVSATEPVKITRSLKVSNNVTGTGNALKLTGTERVLWCQGNVPSLVKGLNQWLKSALLVVILHLIEKNFRDENCECIVFSTSH